MTMLSSNISRNQSLIEVGLPQENKISVDVNNVNAKTVKRFIFTLRIMKILLSLSSFYSLLGRP